ncbi:DUF7342 family protein [Natronorubrum daqingense]|uniref:Transcriptional regulator n=1 Tax=Natronorubrum daqingense TaxID=588898 RepID=A0A1N7FG78_9EURY|nr:transcriptional regulator [Natronorubrum daqingense]SIR99303.1 hypothetical protein SAMN05421809_3195 [Natronorubrum daqingense]
MGRDDSVRAGIEPFPDTDETGSVDAVAERAWKSETTAFERVESILSRTTEWHHASEIAARACVSEPTARKHLRALVESRHASANETASGTQFKRNPDRKRLERVQQLADEHSRSELEHAIREMKQRIRAFEDEYGVTSPESLVEDIEPDDERGWDDRSRWKTTRRNLTFAKTALSFKETRHVDSMSTGEGRPLEENA